MYEDVLYFGGSGYVLSSAAMEALEAMTPNINQDFRNDAVAEDVAMGICMAKVGARWAYKLVGAMLFGFWNGYIKLNRSKITTDACCFQYCT